MFFQSIYQMMSAGTDLSINIRRMDGNMSVAVMPKRSNLKDEAGQLIVPLVLNGTPIELDGQFLQSVTAPLQKAQGILINLETFEKQAQQATTQSKGTKSANVKETKETRDKQDKMEKLLKRAEEAFTTGRYSEATTCFRQAKVFADAEKQKQIEARIQEVQKESSQGCLFPEADIQTQPLMQQPSANGTSNGKQDDGQIQIFTSQTVQQPTQQPVYQTVFQPVQQPTSQQPMPQPQIMQPGAVPQTYYPETPQPQPMYNGYYQNPINGIPPQPMGQQPMGQPQMHFQQPAGQPWQTQQWQQPQPMPQQSQVPVMQTTQGNMGREYHSQPQSSETLTFDKDDESDRELLREDPYAEYIDFPQECRMKDEAQMELICC